MGNLNKLFSWASIKFKLTRLLDATVIAWLYFGFGVLMSWFLYHMSFWTNTHFNEEEYVKRNEFIILLEILGEIFALVLMMYIVRNVIKYISYYFMKYILRVNYEMKEGAMLWEKHGDETRGSIMLGLAIITVEISLIEKIQYLVIHNVFDHHKVE